MRGYNLMWKSGGKYGILKLNEKRGKNMIPVKVRNVEIGTGIPKICVPIVEKTRTEVVKTAIKVKNSGAQIAEWRVDWYEDIFDSTKTEETLRILREVLEEMPVLFTFRSLKEGGARQITEQEYLELNQAAAESGLIDLIDIELFSGEELVSKLIRTAQKNGVKTIVSNHDFESTPEKNEIISRLRKMQKMGADILKMAVMPANARDVITLLDATEEMKSLYAEHPVVTMSMSGKGSISRLCGEIFGSALTFGALDQASAPGQLYVSDLAEGLKIVHRGIEGLSGSL